MNRNRVLWSVQGLLALPTLVLGLLSGFVALGRRPSASRGATTLPAVLQPAH